jgi:hypothetical protein
MSDTPDPDVNTNPLGGQPITSPGPQPTGPKGNPPPVPTVSQDDLLLIGQGELIPNGDTIHKMAMELIGWRAVDQYRAPTGSPKIKIPLPEPTDEQVKDFQDKLGIIE